MVNTNALTNLYRPSFIGFDTLLNDLLKTTEDTASFPKYNLVKTSDFDYRLEFALAGYTQSDITIEVNQNKLTVSSNGREIDDSVEYIHRGISARKFVREFKLAEHVEVRSAVFSDGLLIVELFKNIPEEKKPRLIEIKTKRELLLEGDKDII
jgi:molecular chaperone IbpA